MPPKLHGTHDSSSGSSNDYNSTLALDRLRSRLLSLPRSRWTLHNSYEVISMAGASRNLYILDQLSECLARVADLPLEHIHSMTSTEQQQQLLDGLLHNTDGTPALFRHLCTAVAAALQQLAQGLQQYMQQGQLPAALTVHAVEGISALCYMLGLVSSFGYAAPPAQRQEQRQQRSQMQRDSGEIHSTCRGRVTLSCCFA
jgi:hypothetical protein